MNPLSSSSAETVWRATYINEAPRDLSQLDPKQVDGSWKALTQHWRSDGLEPTFQPGWARARWNEQFLVYDLILLGANAHNRAQRLNEYTWDLGDVCEVFVHVPGAKHYLELHITPENQRLQLQWGLESHAQLVKGQGKLEDFMITNPAWVQTASRVTADYWAVQATIPIAILGLATPSLAANMTLATAACRYHSRPSGEPVLSSTAPFQVLWFHRRGEWNNLVLAPSSPSSNPKLF